MARRLTTYLEKSTNALHAIRTVMLIIEIVMRDYKNQAILLND
jgi:hypothetical protein